MSKKTQAAVAAFKRGIAMEGRDAKGNPKHPKHATMNPAKAKFLKRSMHQTIRNDK